MVISKLTSRRVQLEVELMNKHRRLRVLLEVLRMLEYTHTVVEDAADDRSLYKKQWV